MWMGSHHLFGRRRKLQVKCPCGGTTSKASTYQCKRCKRHRFSPWAGKIPWRRARQPTPVFFPRESHGQRSLVGCSPPGRKESDMPEWRTLHCSHFSSFWLSLEFLPLPQTLVHLRSCILVVLRHLHSCYVTSIMSDSLQPSGRWPARLLCSWNSPGKEWVAMPSSRGSSWSRDQTQASCISYVCRQVPYH